MNEKKPNRLINEKSPYLLQHSYNPVDWHAWNDEAFELAKKNDKPIFLSIGYSTCHWCHVMEHESFEDEEVAKLMNEVFVSIKVDREERPDIDHIYMTVCQIMTGHGGWPLTAILDHNKKPFFTGTYFPKESKYGRIGFVDLIKQIDEAWKNKRDQIKRSADSITQHLVNYSNSFNQMELTAAVFDSAFDEFVNKYNPNFGGFGTSPKFPSPHNLLFLLNYYRRTKKGKALEIVEKTLTEMRKGGIFDHIGFGFHRYSTDQKWLLPHFEKMLYDQAMLLLAYSELYSITKNSLYKKTAEEIIEYVLRDMMNSEGGFFSAEDADSEGVEGKFYVWSEKELRSIFDEDDFQLLKKVFSTEEDGNFAEESTKEFTGENILHLKKDYKTLAEELNLDELILENKIVEIRKTLFSIREKRVHPYKDDKILTDWNGLFIAALARSGRLLNLQNNLVFPEKGIQFILKYLRDSDGNLLHRFRDNNSSINANLDDYAFLIFGLIELYKSTFNFDYLEKAIEFQNIQNNLFWDDESGSFLFSRNTKDLIADTKEIYDNAIPAGNSISLLNLITITKLTADIKFEDQANRLLNSYGEIIDKVPNGFGMFLFAADFLINSTKELVVIAKSEDEKSDLVKNILPRFEPNVFTIIATEEEKLKIEKKIEWIKNYKLINNSATYYLCSNFVCEQPTNNFPL